MTVFFNIFPAILVFDPAGLCGLLLNDKLVCNNPIASVNCRCNSIYARILYIIIILIRIVQCCFPVRSSGREPVVLVITWPLNIFLFVIISVKEIVPMPFPVIHFSKPRITNILDSEVEIYVILPLIESYCVSDFILGFLDIREIIVNTASDLAKAPIKHIFLRIVSRQCKPIGIALFYAK